MDKKILSISIAAYNVSEYLEKTVRSILKEEIILPNIEIIIVNDGSSDETQIIAEKLQLAYPDTIVVINKENGGYGSTINSSLAIARGKYYKLLDGDDWFNTQSLHGFVAYLSQTDTDLIITPYYEVSIGYTIVDNHSDIPETGIRMSDYNCKNPLFAMHEMTIKTNILKNSEMTIAEHCFYTDTEYAFYCFRCATTIGRFSEPVYCYRLGLEGQSVSLSGTRKHHRDFLVVAERLCKVYEGIPLAERNEKSSIYDYILMKYMYNTFKAYMILEKPGEEKEDLREFDNVIKKEYPDAYIVSGNSNLVRLLRKMDFHAYNLISKVVMRKHAKEFS